MSSPQSSRRRPGRPPGETRERTRRRILEAALEAFSATGFEAMSVRDLTRRLGVSHNLVHHHFGTKLELWQAAIDHGVGPTARELFEMLGTAAGHPDPTAVLRDGMRRGVRILERHPEVARILADEFARGGERLDYVHERYLRPGLGVLKRFLGGAGVRDVDPRVAAVFVLSAATSVVTQAALAEKLGLGSSPSARRRMTEGLIDLALGGLVPPAREPVGG